jgi:hypothetical protein
MQVIKSVAGGLFGGILGLGATLFAKKSKPKMLPKPATRDDAAAAIEQEDELRRRRGSAADILTGPRGAEAQGSSIGRLVVSN